jgi:FkbM family methyltransferase
MMLTNFLVAAAMTVVSGQLYKHHRSMQAAIAPFAFPQLYHCVKPTLHPDNHTRSQANEDLWLYENIFSKLPVVDQFGGTFLEIGALDGLQFSNTYFFEKKMDWRGVLIEGHPVNQARLLPNAEKDRRNSVAIPAAICDLKDGKPGTVRFSEGASAVGTDIDTASSKFLNQWHQNETGFIPSDCVPMQGILEATNVVDIDLFSLDVEGSELNVLKTINFHVTNVRVLVVELDGREPSRDEEIRKFLLSHGFAAALESHGNIRDRCGPRSHCVKNEVFINPQYDSRKRPRQFYQGGTSVKC